MAEAIQIKGLRETSRALRQVDKETAKEMRTDLREGGNIVRDDARRRFAGVDARSAAGYRTVVRQRGVAVEQRLGRTTGKRPDYGALQLRDALEPALDAKGDEVFRRMEGMVERVASSAGF